MGVCGCLDRGEREGESVNARQRRTQRRAFARFKAFARRIAELWEEKNQHEARIEEIVFLGRK